MGIALFVALGAATVAMIACAACAFFYSRTSELASRLRSMNSMQGELIEIRDYVSKIDAWAKRINQREVMRERHADGTLSDGKQRKLFARATSNGTMTKDELRALAGITAGRPAPHRENS